MYKVNMFNIFIAIKKLYQGKLITLLITPNNSEDVIIRPFSESIQFNYCLFCGKQISKNILSFNDRKQYSIEIRDDED